MKIYSFLKSFTCKFFYFRFTSLGTKKNTGANPALRTMNGGQVYYKPAFLLPDENHERAGRLEPNGGTGSETCP